MKITFKNVFDMTYAFLMDQLYLTLTRGNKNMKRTFKIKPHIFSE